MSVRIRLNETYREHTGNRETVEVEGATIAECLDHLTAAFPALRPLLFDSEYALGVIIIHRGEVITSSQLDQPVGEGDEIRLLPMMYGG